MLEQACKWAKTLREAADLMTKAWPKAVPRWRRMLLAYKQAKSNLNPFEEPDSGRILRTHEWNCTLNNLQVPR